MAGTKMSGIVAVGAGSLFVYAGIRGFSILKATQNVIKGQDPKSGQSVALLAAPNQGGPNLTNLGPTPGVFGHGGTWSHGALMQLWIMNGGSPGAANNAACHAIQESSGNASVTSQNPDGGTNVGLWQLDTRGKGAGYSISQLQDPNLNAKVAIRGSSNGRDWSAWATPGC